MRSVNQIANDSLDFFEKGDTDKNGYLNLLEIDKLVRENPHLKESTDFLSKNYQQIVDMENDTYSAGIRSRKVVQENELGIAKRDLATLSSLSSNAPDTVKQLAQRRANWGLFEGGVSGGGVGLGLGLAGATVAGAEFTAAILLPPLAIGVVAGAGITYYLTRRSAMDYYQQKSALVSSWMR